MVIEVVFQVTVELDLPQVIEVAAAAEISIKVIVEDLIIIIEEVMVDHHKM